MPKILNIWIESCADCPAGSPENEWCNLMKDHLWQFNVIHENCPLEDSEVDE